MLVSSPASETNSNGLYRLSAFTGILLGFFFLIGAFGHLKAVFSLVEVGHSEHHGFLLLLPGLILAITGLVNLGSCVVLWMGKPWARQFTLATNALSALYLVYLLHRGVPEHPIGFFLAIISSQVILLTAIQFGLIWPSVSISNQPK